VRNVIKLWWAVAADARQDLGSGIDRWQAVAMFGYTFAADILRRMEFPLREPTFLMLTALAGEPMHGYGLIAEVARLSDGRISLRPGTLYGALDRLVDAGLVGVDHEEIVEGRRRRYYRLTEPGGEVLAAETERMRRNVKAATARLRAAKAAPRLSRGLA
jgi:DNA-binding PadR family transcriptional regulator